MAYKRFAALLAFISLAQLSLVSAYQSCVALRAEIGAASHVGECAKAHTAGGYAAGSKHTAAASAQAPKHAGDGQSAPCCVAVATCSGCGTLVAAGDRWAQQLPRTGTINSIEVTRSPSPTYRPNPPPPRHNIV